MSSRIDAPQDSSNTAATVSPCSNGSPNPSGWTQPDPAILWLRRGDRVFVGVMTGLALLLMSIHWIRLSDWGTLPTDIEHIPQSNYQYEIDINRATWVEWAQFSGVGETLARRIVADRESKGNFESIEDLLRVRGVGKRKLAEMRRHLHVHHAASPPPPTGSNSRIESDAEPADSSESIDSDEEIDEVP